MFCLVRLNPFAFNVPLFFFFKRHGISHIAWRSFAHKFFFLPSKWHNSVPTESDATQKDAHEFRNRKKSNSVQLIECGGKSASVVKEMHSRLHRQTVRCYAKWLTTVCHVDTFSSISFLPFFSWVDGFCSVFFRPLLCRCQLLQAAKKAILLFLSLRCCVNDYNRLKNGQTTNRPIVPFCWFCYFLFLFVCTFTPNCECDLSHAFKRWCVEVAM